MMARLMVDPGRESGRSDVAREKLNRLWRGDLPIIELTAADVRRRIL